MSIETIAIVGAGVMGSSWAIVYARAGLAVTVFDRNPASRATLRDRIAAALETSAALCGDADARRATIDRIAIGNDFGAAIADADFIHECIEETLEAKQAVFADLVALARVDAVLASTTSSFPISTFASELPTRERCIVVHPATPPHLLPVTEICPAPFTREDVTAATFALMERCGQVPVLIRKEVPSFVLNRMQGALLVEMFRCLQDDLISPADIDKIISNGFGLRWAFLGPFEAVDLNARGGIREYLTRFGFLFDNLAHEYGLESPIVTPEIIEKLEAYVRERTPLAALPARTEWRDRALTKLRALKQEA